MRRHRRLTERVMQKKCLGLIRSDPPLVCRAVVRCARFAPARKLSATESGYLGWHRLPEYRSLIMVVAAASAAADAGMRRRGACAGVFAGRQNAGDAVLRAPQRK